jgi:glyoxylase-like metal-dependent hydrolase (beta-lactamase superfamily II)
MFKENVYTIQFNRVKVTLLKCNNKLILVDTGMSTSDANTIIHYTRTTLNMPFEKYGYLCIITHRHMDHIGGLTELKKKCDFKIASHIDEVKGIESATGLNVDFKLQDRETLPYCGGIQFIHVPGHTVGNICLYLQNKALLIVGDTLFADDEGNLSPPPDHYCTNPESAKKELKRLLELDFDKIIVSHGKNTINGAKKKFQLLMNRIT